MRQIIARWRIIESAKNGGKLGSPGNEFRLVATSFVGGPFADLSAGVRLPQIHRHGHFAEFLEDCAPAA